MYITCIICPQEAEEFADELDIPFLEVSALQDTNIEKMFLAIAAQVKAQFSIKYAVFTISTNID